MDHDFLVFLEFKTGCDTQSTCETRDLGAFESYRLFNLEYDQIELGTKGSMMTNIVTIMKKTAKNPKEVKSMVTELDSRVKAYKLKLGSSQDPAVIESIFTGMLDPETTRILGQRNIYCDHIESQKLLTVLHL